MIDEEERAYQVRSNGIMKRAAYRLRNQAALHAFMEMMDNFQYFKENPPGIGEQVCL